MHSYTVSAHCTFRHRGTLLWAATGSSFCARSDALCYQMSHRGHHLSPNTSSYLFFLQFTLCRHVHFLHPFVKVSVMLIISFHFSEHPHVFLNSLKNDRLCLKAGDRPVKEIDYAPDHWHQFSFTKKSGNLCQLMALHFQLPIRNPWNDTEGNLELYKKLWNYYFKIAFLHFCVKPTCLLIRSRHVSVQEPSQYCWRIWQNSQTCSRL